jgi:uncharacterized membrane protein (DUF373 family)
MTNVAVAEHVGMLHRLGTTSLDQEAVLDQRASRRDGDRAPKLAGARFRTAHLGAVGFAEDLIHYGVAIVLMIVASVVLYRTTCDLVTTKQPFAQAATTAVNGVLFAIIIMEVMRTVLAHFDRGGLQLQPFLIIGIISAVREILSVGAHLALDSTTSATGTIHVALLELGVNAGVVVGLAAALVLILRLAGMKDH